MSTLLPLYVKNCCLRHYQ